MITAPEFYAAAIPAVILVGLSKGGFAGMGILALPLMALVVSPVQAAAIMLPILLVQDAVSIYAYRKTWDRANVKTLLPPACIGIALGYALAAYVSVGALEVALGVLSIAFAARQLWLRRFGVAPPRIGGALSAWVWGVSSGFSSMIAHAGAPPYQVYILPQRLPPALLAGTGAVYFGVLNFIKVAPYFALGQFTDANLLTAAALFPLAILSTWAGVVLVRRVPAEKFYGAIYALLVVVGVKLIWDGVAAFGA